MRRNQGSLWSDIGFLLLFIMCFAAIIFVSGSSEHYMYHMICLNFAFLLAIVTYFVNLRAGLTLNLLFIFGYGTYILYQALAVGSTIEVYHFFWIIYTPLLTVVVWLVTYGGRQLQAENEDLQKRNAAFVTMDARTSLKNIRAFRADATTFMALSSRYEIPMTLLVITVKYWEDLRRIVSDVQVSDMVQDLSRLNETSIRTNDSLYMLSNEPPTWGLLLFTDREGATVVINRLRERLQSVEFSNKYQVDLNLRIGAATYDSESIHTPLELIGEARKQMEYDV